MNPKYLHDGAVISPCGRYRYALWRALNETRLHRIVSVAFVMLNPSTADAMTNDATIRRCIGFAKRWWCGSLRVANLFALRSTDPEALKTADDPIGPENDAAIWSLCSDADRVVLAWGAHGTLRGRGEAVRRDLIARGKKVYHLGLTKDGEPRHPLYLPGSADLMEWKEAI